MIEIRSAASDELLIAMRYTRAVPKGTETIPSRKIRVILIKIHYKYTKRDPEYKAAVY
jgi:hypothetical protein